MKLFLTFATATVLALSSLACDSRDRAASTPAQDAVAASSSSQPADALPASLVLAAEPQGAKNVKDLRATAQAGDDVVVRGIVAGRKDPIGQNRAILTLLDASIKTCDKMPGDTCKTPWDACCEPSDVLAASSTTVQVVDKDGRPLKAGLDALPGIAPLKTVTVVGKYRPSPDGKAAVVDATGLYITP